VATAHLRDGIIAAARTAEANFITKPISEDGMRELLSGATATMRRATA
jgi:hypothetical protein